MPREERSNWRDNSISQFHRWLDKSHYACDFDMIEYDYIRKDEIRIRAYCEYKARDLRKSDKKLSSVQTMIEAANNYRGGVPALLIGYQPHCFLFFDVWPLNRPAIDKVPKNTRMTRNEFISLIYDIHNMSATDNQIERIARNISTNLGQFDPPPKKQMQLVSY